jgi:hypothetical protein
VLLKVPYLEVHLPLELRLALELNGCHFHLLEAYFVELELVSFVVEEFLMECSLLPASFD